MTTEHTPYRAGEPLRHDIQEYVEAEDATVNAQPRLTVVGYDWRPFGPDGPIVEVPPRQLTAHKPEPPALIDQTVEPEPLGMPTHPFLHGFYRGYILVGAFGSPVFIVASLVGYTLLHQPGFLIWLPGWVLAWWLGWREWRATS